MSNQGSRNVHLSNLITNTDAIGMIDARIAEAPNTSISGHLDIGVLLSYIAEIQERCDAIGVEFSGLEYYFANHATSNPGSWNNGSLTTVIYPTYKSGNDNIPFDPFLSTSSNIVTVIDIKNDLAQYGSSAHVLNKSNMTPPKQPVTY